MSQVHFRVLTQQSTEGQFFQILQVACFHRWPFLSRNAQVGARRAQWRHPSAGP